MPAMTIGGQGGHLLRRRGAVPNTRKDARKPHMIVLPGTPTGSAGGQRLRRTGVAITSTWGVGDQLHRNLDLASIATMTSPIGSKRGHHKRRLGVVRIGTWDARHPRGRRRHPRGRRRHPQLQLHLRPLTATTARMQRGPISRGCGVVTTSNKDARWRTRTQSHSQRLS
jgi:hypothetical protein